MIHGNMFCCLHNNICHNILKFELKHPVDYYTECICNNFDNHDYKTHDNHFDDCPFLFLGGKYIYCFLQFLKIKKESSIVT